MKSNRGQVLVVFVLLLPFILLFLTLVIDYGNSYLKKREISNRVKLIIKERFNYTDNTDLESRLENLVLKNIDNITDYKIHITNEFVSISITTEVKRLFPIIVTDDQEIKVSYRGYQSNDRIILERE